MRILKFWTFVLSLIFSVMISTSCRTKKEDSKNSLVVAIASTPSTLDPRFATDAEGMRITSLVFSALVKIGPGLKVIGDAASNWNYENLVYRFDLRKDIRFSNGQPLTKGDLIFTFEEYQKSSNPFHLSLKPIESVEVNETERGLQLILKLNSFSADLLTSLSVVKLLPQKTVKQRGDDFHKELIGTGSFKIIENESNQITLHRVEDHWLTTPKIKKATFKIIKDTNTLFLKTIKGAVDISQSSLPLNKVVSLKKNQDLQVIEYPGLNMSYILLNLRDPDLKKIDLRKAMAMALNREEIIKYKFDGFAKLATSLLSDINPFHNDHLKVPKFAPERAKKIISELNLKNKTFTFKTSSNKEVVEIAKVLANQLQQIGLNIKIQSYEWGTFYKDVRSGNFEIATMQWVGAIDPDLYRISFHSQQFPPGRNRGFYSNKSLDPLLDHGITISNFESRKEHYDRIQEIIASELPIIPLWYKKQIAVVKKEVKNYIPPANGDYSYLLTVEKD